MYLDYQKTRKKEELKKIDKSLKEYGALLKADTTGAVVKDIRSSTDFLQGYRDTNSINSVVGFNDEMSIKEIVALMKKIESTSMINKWEHYHMKLNVEPYL